MPQPSIEQIESALLSGWPAIRVAHDGRWIWREARGHTKRANAIHCLDPADGDDAEARLARLAAMSIAAGIQPVFRVTPLTAPSATRAMDAAGWTTADSSIVMVRDIPDADWPLGGHASVHDLRQPEWAEAQATLSGLSGAHQDALRRQLELLPCAGQGVLIHDAAGRPAAAAMAIVHLGIAAVFSVVVREDQRGKGHGRTVTSAAFNWCRSAGATSAAIQVLAANTVATNLYASLGFTEAYAYHYRIAATLEAK